MLGSVAGAAGSAMAGIAPTLAIVEVANQIMESAKQSAAATAGRAATQSIRQAFEHSPIKALFQNERIVDLNATTRRTGFFGTEHWLDPEFGIAGSVKNDQQRRLQRFSDALAKGIGRPAVPDQSNFSGNWAQLFLGSEFGSFDASLFRSMEKQQKLIKEVADNTVALSKNKYGRAMLAAELRNKAFYDPMQDVQDIVEETILGDPTKSPEIAAGLRRAKGQADAFEKHQKEADYALARNPQALTFFRNAEGMKRALEERLIEEHQQWNEE
jgi:hypothetical protein